MITVSNAFKDALSNPVKEVYAKIQLLDNQENFLEEITTKVIDGNISANKESQTRRSFSLSLLNDNNDFTWSVGGKIWLDKRIKLWIGLPIYSKTTNEQNINLSTEYQNGTASSSLEMINGNVQLEQTYVFLTTNFPVPSTSGTWTSPVYQLTANRTTISANYIQPIGTNVKIEYRISEDSSNWSSWITASDSQITTFYNYIQVRFTLTTFDMTTTPTISSLNINGIYEIDDIEFVPQGVFILKEMSASSSYTGEKTAKLAGYDKWKLLDGDPIGKFTTVTTINAGVNIADAIKTIAQDAGITKFLFDDCTVTTPYDLSYQLGDSRGKAIKELADLAVYSVYFDVNGFLRFNPQPDVENSPSVWTYDKSDYTLYASSEKRLDDTELFNKVLVIGGSSQTATVSAVSQDNDSTSPTGIPNIGERLFIYNNGSPDPLITDTTLAQARADYELKNRLRIAERQPIQTLPNYLHEVEDVITLVDENTNTNDKYELVSFNLSLKPTGGLMSAEVWKVRKIGNK